MTYISLYKIKLFLITQMHNDSGRLCPVIIISKNFAKEVVLITLENIVIIFQFHPNSEKIILMFCYQELKILTKAIE